MKVLGKHIQHRVKFPCASLSLVLLVCTTNQLQLQGYGMLFHELEDRLSIDQHAVALQSCYCIACARSSDKFAMEEQICFSSRLLKSYKGGYTTHVARLENDVYLKYRCVLCSGRTHLLQYMKPGCI